MTDSSESWSSSESVYSSTTLGSSRPSVSRPAKGFKRFMQNLCDQFKRMTSSAPAIQRWYRLSESESSDPDSDILLRPLSCVFGANIQRSIGKNGSDETVQIMTMVIQIPPGINNETIMYEIIHKTYSSNNAEGASNIKFDKKSLAAILLSKEPAFINLNFPQMDKLVESFSENNTSNSGADSDDENTLDGEANGHVAQDFAGNSCSVTYVKGEVRVYKSGRATLSFGSKVFGLAKAAKSKSLRKVVWLDKEDRMRPLGFIKHCIDVLPQEEVKMGER